MALIDKVVSYYKLDEASGAVIDSVGVSDGTNNGGTPGETGKIDDCYKFDADTEYITTNSPFNGTVLSISCWVKFDSVSVINRIVAKWTSGLTNNADWILYATASGGVVWLLFMLFSLICLVLLVVLRLRT